MDECACDAAQGRREPRSRGLQAGYRAQLADRSRITTCRTQTRPRDETRAGFCRPSLEDRLRSLIELRDYGGGIQQFAVFFVSVDSDPVESERYCFANNRASRYKDLLTGQIVKFVGIAIPVDPETVLRSPRAELPRLLEGLLLAELEAPAYAIPKMFGRQRLLADLKAALA